MSSSSLRRCRFPRRPSSRPGLSTAQADLAKIISIIVTVPPPPLPNVLAACAVPKDISMAPPEVPVNLDLRLGFALHMSEDPEMIAPPALEDEKIPTAHSGVVDSEKIYMADDSVSKPEFGSDDFASPDTSSEGEFSAEAARSEQKPAKNSEVANSACRDEDGISREAEGKGRQGYMDLLLEAAQQVSSGCWTDVGDADAEKTSRMALPPPPAVASDLGRRVRIGSGEMLRSKRRKTRSAAAVVFNVCEKTTEPIVRSSRGRRTQVLPSRYRDSVLEPWRKSAAVLRR